MHVQKNAGHDIHHEKQQHHAVEHGQPRPDAADAATDALLARTPRVDGAGGQLYMKPDTARVFAAAEDDAKKAGDAFVTTERLLIAIAKEGGDAAKILKDAGATAQGLETAAAVRSRA